MPVVTTASTIQWTADPQATSYDVEMVVQGSAPGVNVIGLLTGIAAISVPAGNLIGAATNGANYDIRVRGVNASGAGPWSAPLTVTVQLTPSQIGGLVIV